MMPRSATPRTPGWRGLREMATHRLRQWWRKGGKELLIAAAGFGLLVAALLLSIGPSLRPVMDDLFAPPRLPPLVDLTLVRNANKMGAVCLDGSPPAYHFQRGVGSGARSWVVHIEGGGWCSSVASCLKRKHSALGSSAYMGHHTPFEGILSDDQSQNPDFFNWNKVKIRYCDGASFSGDVEKESQNGSILFFRGQRIWNAVMHELLLKGLVVAEQALLTGCSAGGLATFIHCDSFRELLPKDATVKCFVDGGYFLDEADISGKNIMQSFYHDVVNLQSVGKNLQQDCTSAKEPAECFFPQEIIKYIKTPLFILNAAYDWWQIENVLVPDIYDSSQQWQKCRMNIQYCDAKQLEILHGFRGKMLNSLDDFQKRGGQMFIDSCFAHCQTMSNTTWHALDSPRINNMTIAEAVGSWYFNRKIIVMIDSPYPSNPTCHHKVSII